MSEVKTTQCKVCNEVKPRIQYGTFGDGKSKRWVDDTGKLWNGLVCPSCQRKRALVNMHRLRGKDESNS